MKQYELFNPSDPYTFLAGSKEVAALTVFILGTMYGAQSEDEEDQIPVFLFGGSKEWYQEEFKRSPDEGMAALRKEVAEALCSFMYGRFEERHRYEAALKAITDKEKRQEFIREWQEGHSSLNDIGTFAHQLGEKMRHDR